MKLHHDVLRWAHQVVQFGFLCCYKHQQKLWVKLYGLSVIWVFWNQGLGLSHVLFFFIVCVSTVFIVSLFRNCAGTGVCSWNLWSWDGNTSRWDNSHSQGTMHIHIHTPVLTRGKVYCIQLTSQMGNWNYIIFDLCAFELQSGWGRGGAHRCLKLVGQLTNDEWCIFSSSRLYRQCSRFNNLIQYVCMVIDAKQIFVYTVQLN